MVARDVHDELTNSVLPGVGCCGLLWAGRGVQMPLELLTWYLLALIDADIDIVDADLNLDADMDVVVDADRSAAAWQFFSTYLYTKLLLLAAIMILKSHCFFPHFFPFCFLLALLFAAH